MCFEGELLPIWEFTQDKEVSQKYRREERGQNRQSSRWNIEG